jgi:aldehyde:ferredoxin oxidoreductase
MSDGYAGKILHADLTDRKIEVRETPEDLKRKYIGGVGMGARLLFDSVPPEVDPLDPRSVVYFLTGPLNGTLFPPSGRFEAVARSPLTGRWGHSSCGGFFGPELKYAGYDVLAITGRAESPVYLHVDNGTVELRDASELWGRDTVETTDLILNRLRDHDVKVLAIGPAGENLVRYACVIGDYHRAFGRTGLGCVMGSKNLKAVAVRGTGKIRVHDDVRFRELVSDALKRHSPEGEYWEYVRTMRRYGTFALTDWENAIGRLPTKNHYDCHFPGAEDTIGMEPLRRKHYRRHGSCFNCGIQCKYVSSVEKGPYKGSTSGGPEYETVESFGSNFLNPDTDSIIRANELCNLLGLDTISVGHSISFAFECFEHGILNEKDTGGRALAWGRMEPVLELLESIAYRRDEFSSLLAEGCREASRRIGKGSEAFAIHVNGMEASGQDGRPHKSLGLTYAVNVRGADHLTSLSCIDELGYEEEAKRRYGDRAPIICDRFDERLKGYLVAEMEELYALCDSLTLCKYGVMWPPIYYFKDMGDVLSAATGFEEYDDPLELRRLARRICHLRRAYNLRLGWTRADDALHPRFTEEPVPSGPASGQVVHLEPMLEEYYYVRRYDHDTGYPLVRELEDVGLSDVARALLSQGKALNEIERKMPETDPGPWMETYG